MAWKQQSFERQALFEAVWKEPISKLAKRYSISDVGLRKICVTLEVPMPPRGYWAKLAHGKAPRIPVLPPSNCKPTYTRSYAVAERDVGFEQRVADERIDASKREIPAYVPPLDRTDFHVRAKATVNRLRKVREVDGAVTLYGATWADVYVSPGQIERAERLIDRFAHAIFSVGATFVEIYEPLPVQARLSTRDRVDKRNCFVLHGQEYVLRIRERLTQELVPRPPRTPAQARRLRWEPDFEALAPRYRYLPTGKITLSVVSVVSYYDIQKTEDSASSTIETRLPALVTRLEEASLRRKVELDVMAEKQRERERLSAEWQARKQNKDKLLQKLASLEEMAKDLDRAESLRRLKAKLEVLGKPTLEHQENLQLLAKMADWLDPLVDEAWSEIDDVPDKDPSARFFF